MQAPAVRPRDRPIVPWPSREGWHQVLRHVEPCLPGKQVLDVPPDLSQGIYRRSSHAAPCPATSSQIWPASLVWLARGRARCIGRDSTWAN